MKISILCVLTIFMIQCTDLNENIYDQLSSENYFQNEQEVKSGLTNVYYNLMLSQSWIWQWHLNEVTTYHGVVPVRTNGGWYDGGFRLALKRHTWDSSNRYVQAVYRNYYSVIAASNSFLDILSNSNSSISNKESIKAETKALRAYCYWQLLDLYGNVPIVTKAEVDQQNLPGNDPRKEVFAFVEKQLKEAIKSLPSLKNIDSRQSYYPRIAKETAQAFLVKLYLNAKVYTDNARWEDVINMSNKIINSNVYQLTPSIWDNFKPLNQDSPEIIFAISQDTDTYGTSGSGDANQGGNQANQYGLRPDLTEKFNISYTPFGGPSATLQLYNIYDDDDFRRSLLLKGTQYSPDGDSLTTIVPIEDIQSAPQNQGLVSIKYKPDPGAKVSTSGRGLERNDLVLLRYADILMSKAEAFYRMGNTGGATTLINKVRERNFSPPEPLTNMTLDDILQERSREFIWEYNFRTTLIRFGKFTEPTRFRDRKSESYRTIFPIPQDQIQENENLEQNPGY